MLIEETGVAEADLPLEPFKAHLRMGSGFGTETVIEPQRYWLVRDMQAPLLKPSGAMLPFIPPQGSVQVVFEAGLGESWGAVPADLQQAVLMLAAHYYEYRHETRLGDGCMPFGVSSLIERYRPLRISLGARA